MARAEALGGAHTDSVTKNRADHESKGFPSFAWDDHTEDHICFAAFGSGCNRFETRFPSSHVFKRSTVIKRTTPGCGLAFPIGHESRFSFLM